MTHLMSKLTIYPAVIFLSNLFLPGIHFSNVSQILPVGWIIAIIAYVMDIALLSQYGNPVQTGIDFIMDTTILIIFRYMFSTIIITFSGTIIIALLLAAVEYSTHARLLRIHKGY